MAKLGTGVQIDVRPTVPTRVEGVEEADWQWPRHARIRERKSSPASWGVVNHYEGRNRQVRRMTAHVGFPTLRLIRYAMGNYTLENLANGEWRDA